jgi:hypothetical protein
LLLWPFLPGTLVNTCADVEKGVCLLTLDFKSLLRCIYLGWLDVLRYLAFLGSQHFRI